MGFLCYWENVPSQIINTGSEKNKPKSSLKKVTPIDNNPMTGLNELDIRKNKQHSTSSNNFNNKSPALRSASSVSKTNLNLSLEQLRVLVVDDSIAILKLTRMAVEIKGHIVETATTGLEAKNRMCEKEYDVVLMDFQMPVMGGIEATRRFRKFEKYAIQTGVRKKKQLIIGMSAAQDYEMWLEAMMAGMEDFIQKPFKLVTFMNIVASIKPEFVKTNKEPANTLDGLNAKAGSLESDDLGDSQHTDKSVRFLDVYEKYVSSNEIKNVDNVI